MKHYHELPGRMIIRQECSGKQLCPGLEKDTGSTEEVWSGEVLQSKERLHGEGY